MLIICTQIINLNKQILTHVWHFQIKCVESKQNTRSNMNLFSNLKKIGMRFDFIPYPLQKNVKINKMINV